MDALQKSCPEWDFFFLPGHHAKLAIDQAHLSERTTQSNHEGQSGAPDLAK